MENKKLIELCKCPDCESQDDPCQMDCSQEEPCQGCKEEYEAARDREFDEAYELGYFNTNL